MINYTIGKIHENNWIEAANLAAKAIPNALIAKLGSRFGAKFYSKITEQPYSCAYAARDESDNILGIIIGTTDYPKARAIAFKEQLLSLIIAANFRLLRWSVISWIIKGIIEKAKGKEQNHTNKPHAELMVIVVRPEVKGSGLAQKLVQKMEKFMLSKSLSQPYAILTEKANIPGNKFYKKIGATFIKTSLHHGKEINTWHKVITPMTIDEK